MPITAIRGKQVLDGTIQRADLDTTTAGQAVVAKIVQGTNISLSSTGGDSGTGDVTISDNTPLASNSTSGLMRQTSGNTTDFIDGTNNSQPLQPVIWAVRLRSFNAIGNPTFEVDQRNIGGVVTNPAGGTFIIDRWFKGGVGTYTVNCRQFSDTSNPIILPGTNYRLSSRWFQVVLTTQETTMAAGDFLIVRQIPEGIQFRELASDVHSFSLLVQATVAPLKFGVSIRDPGNTRSLTKLCTISTANIWQLIPLSNLPIFPGAGNFSVVPGVVGYDIAITLACGSTNMSPANDTWQTGNFVGAVGQDNFCAQPVNSTFYIGFIQHEPGAFCTTPIDSPFTQNLDECLRYYDKSYQYGTKAGTVTSAGATYSYNAAAVNPTLVQAFKKRMAKIPAMSAYSPTTGAVGNVRDLTNNVDRLTGADVQTGDACFAGFTVNTLPGGAWFSSYHWIADTGW